MYLFLNNKDAVFHNKKEYIFDIPGGLWLQDSVALAEFEYTLKKAGRKPNNFDLCCDICDTSYVGPEYLPILRRIYCRKPDNYHNYESRFYIPVSKPWTSSLRLYIKPVPRDDTSFELESFNCTLHIKS